MSAKHTLGTDLERDLSYEHNTNSISREIMYDEIDSVHDQKLLRKLDLRWRLKSTMSCDWHRLTVACLGYYLYLRCCSCSVSWIGLYISSLVYTHTFTHIYSSTKRRKCQVST
jgi:hypothetical protein